MNHTATAKLPKKTSVKVADSDNPAWTEDMLGVRHPFGCILCALAVASCGGGETLSLSEHLAAETLDAEAQVRSLASIDLQCVTTADCAVLPIESVGWACGFSGYVAVSKRSSEFIAARSATDRNHAARTEYAHAVNQLPVPCIAARPDEGLPLCENLQCRIAPLQF
jgi:hypothetical protein